LLFTRARCDRRTSQLPEHFEKKGAARRTDYWGWQAPAGSAVSEQCRRKAVASVDRTLVAAEIRWVEPQAGGGASGGFLAQPESLPEKKQLARCKEKTRHRQQKFMMKPFQATGDRNYGRRILRRVRNRDLNNLTHRNASQTRCWGLTGD